MITVIVLVVVANIPCAINEIEMTASDKGETRVRVTILWLIVGANVIPFVIRKTAK